MFAAALDEGFAQGPDGSARDTLLAMRRWRCSQPFADRARGYAGHGAVAGRDGARPRCFGDVGRNLRSAQRVCKV